MKQINLTIVAQFVFVIAGIFSYIIDLTWLFYLAGSFCILMDLYALLLRALNPGFPLFLYIIFSIFFGLPEGLFIGAIVGNTLEIILMTIGLLNN